MHRTTLSILFSLVVSFGGVVAHAGPAELRLSSSSDLQNLNVGDTFTIDVLLEDLSSGDELQMLSAGVDVGSPLLSRPATVRAGGLITDAATFDSSSEDGFVDAIVDVAPGNSEGRIRGDGTFFSIDLTAANPGSGTVSFDFVDALQYDPNDPTRPTEFGISSGPGLDIVVRGGAQVIPLPAGFASGMSLMGALGLGSLLRSPNGRRALLGALRWQILRKGA